MKPAASLNASRLVALLIVVAGPLLYGYGLAASAPFAGYIKYVRYRVHYEVNADGTHVETWDVALKVLADQGISEANRASISYSDRLQSVKIQHAYTLKKDGSRVDVPPSNFQEEVNKGRGNAAPMFSDLKTITVAFPEVAVGATVAMVYTRTQREPTFPGNFSCLQSFSKFMTYDDAQVSISAPGSLKLQVEARGVKGGEVAGGNGRRNWLWTYHSDRIATPEPGSVSALDYGPLIVASTFKDYGAVAAAYDARAKAKAVPDESIRKLAAEVTRNAKTPREQAAALYYWVANNIDYAGNCVGVGSVVPHDAALVLKNRMGDCKDRSTLLLALLAVKGIAATSVLINAGNAYTLPEVPSIQVFNHVLTYIPSLNVYADSTSRFTQFGSLPLDDAGKPVIFTSGYNGIQHTPPTNWKQNGIATETIMTIKPDGSGQGETKVAAQGIFASGIRAAMAQLPPNMEEEAVRRTLAQNGYTGTGTLHREDPTKPVDIYRYSRSYKITDVLNLPGPAAFTVRELAGSNTIATFVAGANGLTRTVDFTCMGAYGKESFTFHLPDNVKVTAMPSDVELKGRDATYSAKYQRHGNTVTVVRELDDMTAGNVCTPQEDTAFRPFALRVMKDLRTQILYR
jgi:transglutaminase-like putative cysteine protease